ncbi:6-phosphogluconolactonase [Schaalia vaccimaxillae]|uniref:6-phosphogluconolactonase n=1 Tax=Schaalia vaccimaxillae TaxID=183916 RepID=UPI0003B33551|nr:6-phosphogluconolactonase [Schaalia vaccimaxillae]
MTSIRVFPDASRTAQELANASVDKLVELTSTKQQVEWAVSGGFITEKVLPLMAARIDEVDWKKIRVWWVDERYVPSGHSDRNDDQAVDALFHHVPEVALMRMPSSDSGVSVDQAAATCASYWDHEMGNRAIDFALIGMGPDGHIASLFPGEQRCAGGLCPSVLPVTDSPKPPPVRLSLSMEVLQMAQTIWIGSCGSAKALAIAEALSGASAEKFPVAGVLGEQSKLWLDEDAASQIVLNSRERY